MSLPLSGCAASPSLFGRGTTPSLRGGPCLASLTLERASLIGCGWRDGGMG